MRCTGQQTGWRISSGKEVRHFWARDFARCGVRGTCAVRRGNKKGRHLRFLPSLNTRFPCGVAWVQMVDCVSVEKGERQRIFTSVSFSANSQCQIPYCYTYRLLYAGANIVRPRNGKPSRPCANEACAMTAAFSILHSPFPISGKIKRTLTRPFLFA